MKVSIYVGWQVALNTENNKVLSNEALQKRRLVITLLGHHRVGKSAITNAYFGVPFEETLMTLGASLKFKELEYNESIYRLQVIDIPGQGSFEHLRRKYIRGTDGAILVFDLTQPATFQNILDWVKEYSEANSNDPKPFIILGNKLDLIDERQIKLSEVRRVLTMLEAEPINQMVFKGYFETSAKTGESVLSSIKHLTDAIIEFNSQK